MRENNELENYRKQIDEIDKQTAKLFEARMNAVKGISAYKKTRGIAVTDKTREADVIRRNGAYISDDEIREYYVRFISSVIQISRDLQIRETKGMKAAYYGNEGSACFFAAKKAFPNASLYAYPSVIAAYRAAEQGECDCAVLPIDGDSSEDPRTVKDLAFTGSLYINAVVKTKDVQDFPEGHGADSSAAKRFAVFSRVQNLPSANEPDEDLHFILTFAVKNESGSLAQALNIIGAHDFNIRTLTGRPEKDMSRNYYFYAEADGNVASENGRAMLRELSAVCAKMKLAGTYR